MSEQERNRYLEAYYANEADANRQMSFANVLAAILMLVIWILYLTNIFKINTEVTRVIVNISFPVGILVLCSPLIFVFGFQGKHLKKPSYKYFVLVSFVVVIAGLNIILPKHTAIMWALCILMTNHYYNPKVGLSIFIAVIISSLFCMFFSMFVGEFDANLLLGNDVLEKAPDFYAQGVELYAKGPVARYELLVKLHELGYNRMVDSLLFYFFPRALILSLVFFVSYGLNLRTYKLLVSEIQVNSEQEKTKTELEVAKEIQLATLPSEISTSEDIEIVAELKAAKEVGGDFYDYFKIDEDHTAIVVGDISGKGIPAAMFMMKTITCFKNLVAPNKSPAQILREVNASLYDNNNSQMFVTCFLAIINEKTGELKFANAGHNPPIIGSNLKFRYLKCNPGFVLGGLKDAFVVDESIMLEKGESITIYTDGITEARNEKGGFYGEDKFLDFFNSREFTCVVEIHHALKDDLAKFTEGFDQSDDITVMTLQYSGDESFYIEKSFDAKLENIQDGLNTIEEFCDKHQVNMEFKLNLLIVADELYSNIVKYGYENNGGEVFTRLLFNKDKNEFVLTVIDRAPAFNQLDINNSPLVGEAKDNKIGGLGILIVKKIMSEYAYDRINGKNILVLRKKF